MVVVILHPPLLHLLVWVIDNDVGDGVLAQLEDRRVDERVGEEVVAAELEELLDRRWQVGVRDIEEGRRVVDAVDSRALNTATCR